MSAAIGEKAPEFEVSEWVQGPPTSFAQELGHIVLIEVIQVNCPGCFIYGIPEAINIYNNYRDEGVTVLGLATAFEDFDKNTVENLRKLTATGEVIGETRSALTQLGRLREGDKLPFDIPFPFGMDNLTKSSGEVSQEQILQFIYPQIPNFDEQPADYKNQLIARVKQYMQAKEYSAATFEKFALRGTPSTILVDRKGLLRDVSFGQSAHLEPQIQQLVEEDG